MIFEYFPLKKKNRIKIIKKNSLEKNAKLHVYKQHINRQLRTYSSTQHSTERLNQKENSSIRVAMGFPKSTGHRRALAIFSGIRTHVFECDGKSDSRKPAVNSFHERPWNDATHDCVNVTQRASRTTASEELFHGAFDGVRWCFNPVSCDSRLSRCIIGDYPRCVLFFMVLNGRSWSAENFILYTFF